MSKRIPLGENEYAIVDNDAYQFLSGFLWRKSDQGYAVTQVYVANGIGRKIKMHRVVMLAPTGSVIDHLNQNRLDNRKENLVFTSASSNTHNSRKRSDSKTKYKGVKVDKHGYISARVSKNGKSYYLGIFKSQESARDAVIKKSLELFGKQSPYYKRKAYAGRL